MNNFLWQNYHLHFTHPLFPSLCKIIVVNIDEDAGATIQGTNDQWSQIILNIIIESFERKCAR
jgi:hypothetical protein